MMASRSGTTEAEETTLPAMPAPSAARARARRSSRLRARESHLRATPSLMNARRSLGGGHGDEARKHVGLQKGNDADHGRSRHRMPPHAAEDGPQRVRPLVR